MHSDFKWKCNKIISLPLEPQDNITNVRRVLSLHFKFYFTALKLTAMCETVNFLMEIICYWHQSLAQWALFICLCFFTFPKYGLHFCILSLFLAKERLKPWYFTFLGIQKWNPAFLSEFYISGMTCELVTGLNNSCSFNNITLNHSLYEIWKALHFSKLYLIN